MIKRFATDARMAKSVKQLHKKTQAKDKENQKRMWKKCKSVQKYGLH